jgi:hypothetical protein
MDTNNIISTPDITGNIGSCTSQSITTVAGRTSIWTEKTVQTITNSCTGEVVRYESWQFTPTCFFTGLFFFVVLFIICGAIASKDTY